MSEKFALFLRGVASDTQRLQKLVITTFVGLPDGSTIHYFELCGPDVMSFEVSADGITELADVGYFYRDTRASNAMYDQYVNLDPITGRHKQTIGDDELTVLPTSLAFTGVAPRSREGQKCYNINVVMQSSQTKQQDESWGGWLRVTQRSSQRVRTYRAFRLDLVTRNLRIENFYWFVILPSGYRSINETFRLEEYPRKLQHSDREAPAVMEYTLPSDFSVYADWTPQIYKRSILKNRRSLTIHSDGLVSIEFGVVDEAYTSRLGTASFFSGIILSLVANGLASLVFYALDKGLSAPVVCALIGLVVVAVLTTWIGWKNLVNHR